MIDSHILNLLTEYLTGEISEQHQAELERWLDEREGNRQFFEKFCADRSFRERWELRQKIDLNAALQKFESRTGDVLVLPMRKRWRLYAAVAAMLVLAIGISWFYLRQAADSNESLPLAVVKSNQSVGNNLMTLILPEGEQVLLNKKDILKQVEGGMDIIFENGHKQKYRSVDATSYNTLKTPLCCDFCLTLSDGTKVWMNALSTLRYPVSFSENERIVYASGELFLEVAKDSKRPFYVILDSMKIEVLGTSFNINAYADESNIEVTLEKGSIRAYTDNRIYNLLPDRQLRMNRLTKEVDIREVKSVDYTSWKSGRYVFKGVSLCDVTKVLKRWYGVEFVFERPELKNLVFTGVVDKEEPIGIFMRRLSLTSKLEYKQIGQKIFIR